MAIINVSKSREKPMLNTVRMLRRRLRNVFLRTNRAKVMDELRSKQETDRRRCVRSPPTRIDDSVPYRQPCQTAYSVMSLYFPSPAEPTSGDRHRSWVTNVTQSNHHQ